MFTAVKKYQVIISTSLIAFAGLVGTPVKSYIKQMEDKMHQTVTIECYDNRPKKWTPAMSKVYARGYMSVHYPHWNKSEWHALGQLWGKESAWNHMADNPWSSAYGIAQVLKTKPGTPAPLQIEKGLSYISHRYNKPSAAWKHWQQRGWY